MKTKIQIKSYMGNLLFEYEAEDNTIKKTLQGAVLRGAVLQAADLQNADLRGADLRDAVLRDADLRGADLRDADLRDAVLQNADLRDADLRDADLRDADLQNADLQNADLQGAVLRGAVLQNADLRDAVLRGAVLTPIRDDFWAVLSSAPKEVHGLRKAIIEGRINGSSYEGECACLVGTIANIRGVNYETLQNLRPDARRPAERFFLAIKKGDLPKTNQFSKLALEWIDEWLENMEEAFSKGEIK